MQNEPKTVFFLVALYASLYVVVGFGVHASLG